MMRPYLLLSAGFLAVAASGQASDLLADVKPLKEFERAYQQGREEADRELREGRATVYTYGLRMIFENLDCETGLPFKAIAGCEIDSEIIGRRQGHDDRINDYIRLHGLPSNSFKKHEQNLFNLRRFFDRESKTQKPSPLWAGGPVVESPDGRYSVRPIEIGFKKDDGSPGSMLNIIVADQTIAHRPRPLFWDEGVTDLVWGPVGSRFAVIRCKRVRREDDFFSSFYLAVDLQRGEWLREESVAKEDPDREVIEIQRH